MTTNHMTVSAAFSIVTELLSHVGNDEIAAAIEALDLGGVTPSDFRAKWDAIMASRAKTAESRTHGPSDASVRNKKLAARLLGALKAKPETLVTIKGVQSALELKTSQAAMQVINVLLSEGVLEKDSFIKSPVVYHYVER